MYSQKGILTRKCRFKPTKERKVTTQPNPQIRFLAPTLTPLTNNTIQRYALHSALSIDSQLTSSQRRNHNVPTQTVSHSTNENSNREAPVVNLRRSERTHKPKTIFDI